MLNLVATYLVQGNTVHTPRATFTEEDKIALSMYDSFEGFQIHNIKISQIFSEFTDSIETFDFPEDFWPEGETFLKTKIKERFISILIVMYPS